MVAGLIAAIWAVLYTFLVATPQIATGALKERLIAALGASSFIEVGVESDPPIRAAAGEIDRLWLTVANATVAGVLPIDRFSLEARDLRYDAGALLIGRQLFLLRPFVATASLDLREADLLEALRAKDIRKRLSGLQAPKGVIPGVAAPRFDLVATKLTLAAGRISFGGQIQIQELGLVVPVLASGRPILLPDDKLTIVEPSLSIMGRTMGPEQLATRMGAMPVVDLAELASGDIRFHLSRLDIDGGRMHLEGAALVSRFPTL